LSTAAVSAAERKLRIALIWNGALQMETTIDKPQPIVAGSGSKAMLPLPSDVAAHELTLLSPQGNGYRVNLSSDMGGAIWRSGVREEVRALDTDPHDRSAPPSDVHRTRRAARQARLVERDTARQRGRQAAPTRWW
jgi:hypothetical protein